MATKEELLTRLGEIRDAIEVARNKQDTASLFALTGERDTIRSALAEMQAPTREELEAELRALRSQVGGFDPQAGMMHGMAVGGGGGSGGNEGTHASSVVAAAKAAEQQADDSGINRVTQRIVYLEEQLRKLDG